MNKDFSWAQLLNPEFYITLEVNGVPIGIYMVLFIVFAETGLFAGFFLPGDSLLFLSGIYCEKLAEPLTFLPPDYQPVFLIAFLIALAGILGNAFGYWFGLRSGRSLYNKEDNFIFKKKYLYQSEDFFQKHGSKAIIIARFLPIVRTFVPIIAGIVKMKLSQFMLYNVISSFLWSFILVCSGHYLYQFCLDRFGIDLKHYIELIVISLIAITTFPLILKVIKSRSAAKKEANNISDE